MIMIDQSRRLSEPLRWTRGGRLAVVIAAACLILVVVGIGVYALVGGTKQAKGCISVPFASTLGASYVHACGTRAREVCASPQSNPGAAEGGALRKACRREGYAYGTS